MGGPSPLPGLYVCAGALGSPALCAWHRSGAWAGLMLLGSPRMATDCAEQAFGFRFLLTLTPFH